MQSFNCIFCTEEKSQEHLSEEHIIPKSLGNRNFTVDNCVCEDCNDWLGYEVDAEFCNSDLIQFIRFHYQDYLSEENIPNFCFESELIDPLDGNSYPIRLRFSKNGIEVEGRWDIQEIENGSKVFIPDTEEGRTHYERMKNSENKEYGEWETEKWPALPDILQKVFCVDLPYAREAFKIYLEYLALIISPNYVLGKSFDDVRSFIKGESDLDDYAIRMGWRNRDLKGKQILSHRIYFRSEYGEDFFCLFLFDYLRIDIHLGDNLRILPKTRKNILLKKKRNTNYTTLFDIISSGSIHKKSYEGPEIQIMGKVEE